MLIRKTNVMAFIVAAVLAACTCVAPAFAEGETGQPSSDLVIAPLPTEGNDSGAADDPSEPDAPEQSPTGKGDLEPGTYYVQPKACATRVLDVHGNNIIAEPTAGVRSQCWVVAIGEDGYATLTNQQTGKSLAVKGSRMKNGANIAQRTTDDQDLSQKWIIKKSKEQFTVLSAIDDAFALQIASNKKGTIFNAVLHKRTSGNGELFSFIPKKPVAAKEGKKTVKNGVYVLSRGVEANNVIGIEGASKKSGANAIANKFGASTSQAFQATYDGEGFYTLTNLRSGKKLGVAAACSVPKLNVAQYDLKTSSRVKWRIEKHNDGYRFVNKASGLALETAGSDYENGANMQVATSRSSNTQRFMLIRPHDIPVNKTGLFYITVNGNKNSVIGIRDDSRMEGSNVAVRYKRNTNLQRFAIQKAGSGLCYLSNVATGRVASLKEASKGSGVSVVMRDKRGSKLQKWNMVYTNDFSLAFESAYSGMRLTVSGNGGENASLKARKANKLANKQSFGLTETYKRTDEVVTIDVPCYWQNPELPTGCESVALTNALNYWGFNLWKTTIADRWMPYGGSGVYNFIGNPRNSSGWIICAPGIANTANAYLKYQDSNVRAVVDHGSSLYDLRKYLDRGEPVVVWTTIGMGEPTGVNWWSDGYPLRGNNHAVVLSGYDPNTGNYRVSDSLAGVVWRNGSRFEYLYNLMGRQAVVLKR